MFNRKKWLEWIDNLREDELFSLMHCDLDDFEVPPYLDKIVFNKIDEEAAKNKNIFTGLSGYFENHALTFALSLIAVAGIILASIFIPKGLNVLNENKCTVIALKGTAFFTRNNKNVRLKLHQRLKKSSTISTSAGSSAEILIGKHSHIIMEENSTVKLAELFKKSSMEKTDILVNNGRIECSIGKQNEASVFIVETDAMKIRITGTQFTVDSTEKFSKLTVKEGSVKTLAKIKTGDDLAYIEKVNPRIAEDIKRTINNEVNVGENNSLVISTAELSAAGRKISGIIKSVRADIEKGTASGMKTETMAAGIEKGISEINDIKNSIYHIENISKHNESGVNKSIKSGKTMTETKKEDALLNGNFAFNIKKLPKNPGIDLSGDKTTITADGQNIYAASNSNGTLYCIGNATGKLKWKYGYNKKPNSLKGLIVSDKITNGGKIWNYKERAYFETGKKPDVNSLEFLILTTTGGITVIEPNGKIFMQFSIHDVLYEEYPAFPVKLSAGDILIPCSKAIYKFDVDTIAGIDNFKYANDRLYISDDNRYLYCLFRDERVIRIYELKDLYFQQKDETDKRLKQNNNYIKWESKKLKSTSVIAPVIFKDSIFTADTDGNVYKFKAFSNDNPQIVKINYGIVSNIVCSNNNLYFVANDGCLYKINIDSFDSAKKIAHIDRNPDSMKYKSKKLLINGNDLYFCMDNGCLFWHDLADEKSYMVNLDGNSGNQPLMASPVMVNNRIFVMDKKSNIYSISKK